MLLSKKLTIGVLLAGLSSIAVIGMTPKIASADEVVCRSAHFSLLSGWVPRHCYRVRDYRQNSRWDQDAGRYNRRNQDAGRYNRRDRDEGRNVYQDREDGQYSRRDRNDDNGQYDRRNRDDDYGSRHDRDDNQYRSDR